MSFELIILGGKEYKISFSFNSLCEWEARAGRPVSEIGKDVSSLSGLRLLLFCGLLDWHKNIFKTPEELGTCLNLSEMNSLVEATSKALSASFGTDNKKKESREEKEKKKEILELEMH